VPDCGRQRLGAYFQFVYSTFTPGTKVPTFRADLAPQDVAALEQVNAFFATQLGQDPAGPRAGEQKMADTVTVAAGGSQQLHITGSRAITAIRGSVECGDREDEMAALRELVLSISFDDEPGPSVWTPLGISSARPPARTFIAACPRG